MKNTALKALVVVLCGACHHEAPPQRSASPTFVVQNAVLYREDASGRLPVLALDSASAPSGVPSLPPTWTPIPGSSFGVAARTMRHIAASPQADWVAWETSGAVHDLVGVSPGKGGKPVILDFYFDSAADSMKWSSSRTFTAYYMAPSGVAEARVYDVVLGKRIK